MLVVDRASQTLEDRHFRDLPDRVRPGDCLVLNNSKVIPSRLFGKRPTGGRVEVFLLRQLEPDLWTALVKPGRLLQVGAQILFNEDLTAEVVGRADSASARSASMATARSMNYSMRSDTSRFPPYIKRGDDASDRERYQTVYAREKGSVAAPTARIALHARGARPMPSCRRRNLGSDTARRTRDLPTAPNR